MDEPFEPTDPALYALVAQCVRDGLRTLEDLETGKKYINNYFDWPQLSYFDNGLPSIHVSHWGGPISYDGVLIIKEEEGYPSWHISSLQQLIDYMYSQERIRLYFEPVARERKYFNLWCQMFIGDIFDRYVHIYSDRSYSDNRLMQVYKPAEVAIFSEVLPVDIVVPILFQKFAFAHLELGERVAVSRMSEPFQLARASARAYGPGVHDSVLGAATHALVLTGWEVKNSNRWYAADLMSDVNAYPLEQIDRFFTAARIVSNASIGYAQLLLRPVGWARTYKAHLPPLEGTSIRRYPMEFENFYWLREIATTEERVVQEWGQMYNALINDDRNQMSIASRRLDAAFFREHEDDAVLDATIAMETLLLQGERQEQTHKLALRVAALSKIYDGDNRKIGTAIEVFRRVKRIYAYRSAVAHGSTDTTKQRQIKLSEEAKAPAVSLALTYLAMIMEVLLKRPEYSNADRIDEELLLAGPAAAG
jgi:hypothetical protein